MSLPRFGIVDAESEMITARLARHRLEFFATDEMQFLRCAKPKPCARKREGRPRDLPEQQNFAIKSAAFLDVAHENGDMIQFQSLHRWPEC